MNGTLISIITTCLGAISIVIATFTFIQQRKFNKNSVRPIINVAIGDYEDDIFVELVNKGIGPATIEKLSCVYDGDILVERTFDDVLERLLSQSELPTSFIKEYTTFMEDVKGITMAPNDSIFLIKKKNPNEDEKEGLRRVLKDITIMVDYTDIYNIKFHEKRKLVFFGRHF